MKARGVMNLLLQTRLDVRALSTLPSTHNGQIEVAKLLKVSNLHS